MVNRTEACCASARIVALGGVGVAYRVGFFARAAPRDACCRHDLAGRSCWCPAAFPPKACSICSSAAPRSSRRGRPRRKPVSSPIRSAINQPAAAAGADAARRRLRTCLLRAQLRRQVFSADHARQRLAGADLPGLLSGQRHQGVLRQQYRRRDLQHWRALCRQRKRLCLPQGVARRLHLQRPQAPPAWRRSISRSTPRCAPAT